MYRVFMTGCIVCIVASFEAFRIKDLFTNDALESIDL